MTSPSQLAAAFERGEIARDAYWAAMGACHAQLGDYATLLQRGGDVERIELSEEGLDVVFRSGIRMAWQPEQLRSVCSVAVNHGGYEAEERRLVLALVECSPHAPREDRSAETWPKLLAPARGGIDRSVHASRVHYERVIFDIGANAGYYSLHLAQSGARVHAFEPVPETFEQLQRNIRANGFESRIESVPFALGRESGQATFFIPEFHGHVAASRQPLFPDRDHRRVTVQMQTLDGFVESRGISRLDFIKCDVEGGERDVILGGLEAISRFRPWLMLELLRKWSAAHGYHPDEVLGVLKERGYRCWSCTQGEIVEHPRIDEECRPTNFFFLPAEEGERPLRKAWAASQEGGHA